MVPLPTRPVNVPIQLRLAHRLILSHSSISAGSINIIALLFVRSESLVLDMRLPREYSEYGHLHSNSVSSST